MALSRFGWGEVTLQMGVVVSTGRYHLRGPLDWLNDQSLQVPLHTAWYVSGVRGRKAFAWLSNTNKGSAMMPTLKPSRAKRVFTSLNVLVIARVSCRGSKHNPTEPQAETSPPPASATQSSPGYG